MQPFMIQGLSVDQELFSVFPIQTEDLVHDVAQRDRVLTIS